MTESDTTPRRGRRARALSPEETAALESRGADAATDDPAPVPGVRGAVAPPTAEAPVPTLRKFGRRARIIELSEDPTDPEATAALAPVPDEKPASDASIAPAPAAGPAPRTAVVDRDQDGVELGELSVGDAPDPRPAPRFDGKVLHRPERSGNRQLLWLVWILIAVALIVLIALLLSGVIGPGEASALDASVHDLFADRLVLEVPAA
ncbi:hypothetical protein [Brachybacterium sp. FME24]|uniref:hypothetical protein n=1 Tax=Brachybacterium sp. FME24 TaxID=2742605 RepID=UPI001868BFFE|nr:hypothetical protein [Brachybacterium sp. FME24]